MSTFQTARFYELLGNRGGRLEREGPFLLEALARAPLPRVADVACGLGLHAAWLAEHDAHVTVAALDASEEMVRHARETRPHPRIRYERGDMRAIRGGPYGLIMCVGNSLSLLADQEQLQQFFAGAFNALAPGGLLITQTLNYQAEGMRRPRIRVEREHLPEGELAAVKRFQPLGDHTILAITYYVVTSDTLSDTTETAILRHWSAETLRRSAQQAGFVSENLYGDYQRSALNDESPDVVMIAVRGSKP